MSKNYFQQIPNNIGELKHFPYKNFSDFKTAAKDGDIVDFSIAMDLARQWVTNSDDSPKGWRYLSNFLMLLPYLFTIFYILMALIIKNYWLLPYSIIPIIFMFIANPIGRRIFKWHYYFVGLYLVSSILINALFSPLYWLPLLLLYLSLNQLYGGSAQIVRENLTKNERVLCQFWKWWDLVIWTKDNARFSQRYYEENGKVNYYEDIEEEWKEYVDIKYGKTPSLQEEIMPPQITENICPSCGNKSKLDSAYCKHCGKKL